MLPAGDLPSMGYDMGLQGCCGMLRGDSHAGYHAALGFSACGLEGSHTVGNSPLILLWLLSALAICNNAITLTLHWFDAA